MTVSFDIIKEKIILGGAMSVTVQDCLRLPSFHSARVIAGKNGLGRIVSFYEEIKETAASGIDRLWFGRIRGSRRHRGLSD